MNPVQILHAGNVVAWTPEGPRQTLSFAVLVQNLAYEKSVQIHWAGNDGVWRWLPCRFARPAGGGQEVWEAVAHFGDPEKPELPGNITFAAQARMAGFEGWDSGGAKNYTVRADAGIWVAPSWPLLNVRIRDRLEAGDTFLPISVAVHPWLQPRRVYVRWSTDGWRTAGTTECVLWRQHWEKPHTGATRHPFDAGTAVWVTHLPVRDCFRVEYALACEGADGTTWDNNFGANYQVRHDRLKVLTLNLHCGQEDDQDAKLWTIARAIDEHEIDVVCLQEVAQPWEGDQAFEENTAKKIRDRLSRPYQLVTDWSHRGFGVYREGCAILSRLEVEAKDSCYVSPGQDENSIHSRRVVMARVRVPQIGPVNVYSVHLSWWQDGFRQQFDRLNAWASEKHDAGTVATLLLGDFNARTGGEGYSHVTGPGGFEDQHLKANRAAVSEGWMTPDDQRIDFIFLRPGNRLEVKASKALFTASDYGRVSDHQGFYAEFEPPV